MRQFLEVFDIWPFQPQIGTPLTRALENVNADFDFSIRFCCLVTRPYWSDGQTDGRRIVRPIGWPHKN